MKIKDIFSKAGNKFANSFAKPGEEVGNWEKANKAGHVLNNIAGAIAHGASGGKGVVKGTKYKKGEVRPEYAFVAPEEPVPQKSEPKAPAQHGDKPQKSEPKAPAQQQAKPVQQQAPKRVGLIPVPKGNMLKLVMPSSRGNVDYFRYPNGKWYVQWTSGSALQVVTNPETVENLNYMLPSQAGSIKIIPYTPAQQPKGKKKQ